MDSKEGRKKNRVQMAEKGDVGGQGSRDGERQRSRVIIRTEQGRVECMAAQKAS